jgi:hypothetical protein
MHGKPTIAEEQYARTIAFWHGMKLMMNEAHNKLSMAEFHKDWSPKLNAYVDKHWKEYVPAARGILSIR